MNKNLKLPGDYIAGFVDGEGCFALKFRRDKQKNVGSKKVRKYFYWGVEFAIVLRSDDDNILKLIKNELDCGSITFPQNGKQVRYSIQNTKDLAEKIIPFFKRYQLRAKKADDFDLWSQAVEIINKHRDGILNIKRGQRGFTKKEMDPRDLAVLQEIRKNMILYKSKRAKLFKWGN